MTAIDRDHSNGSGRSNVNFNRRLQALEAKLNADCVTLKLKDGTVQRVPGQALWDTAFEAHRVWSQFLLTPPAEQRIFGVVPDDVRRAVPLLQRFWTRWATIRAAKR